MTDNNQTVHPELTAWPIDAGLAKHVAEQETINRELAAQKVPEPGTVDIKDIRNFRLYNADGSMKPPLVEQGSDDTLEAENGEIRVRRFSPENARGIYLHFHGGGWVMGSVYEQDAVLWDVARKTQLEVISVDYPLAPERSLFEMIKFVSQAAAQVMATHADDTFIIGGESAGAHLALSAALSVCQDDSCLSRIAGLNLTYGIYDLSMTPSQRNWGSQMMGLSTDYLQWFYELALPGLSAEERAAPELSPLYRSDLRDLPPALFTVGELDPLLDDSLFMATRWQAAGNYAELRVYPRAPHGFNGLPSGMGAAANTRIHQFINACLDV